MASRNDYEASPPESLQSDDPSPSDWSPLRRFPERRGRRRRLSCRVRGFSFPDSMAVAASAAIVSAESFAESESTGAGCPVGTGAASNSTGGGGVAASSGFESTLIAGREPGSGSGRTPACNGVGSTSVIHFGWPLQPQTAEVWLAARRTDRPHSGHFQKRRTSQLSLSPGPLMALLPDQDSAGGRTRRSGNRNSAAQRLRGRNSSVRAWLGSIESAADEFPRDFVIGHISATTAAAANTGTTSQFRNLLQHNELPLLTRRWHAHCFCRSPNRFCALWQPERLQMSDRKKNTVGDIREPVSIAL